MLYNVSNIKNVCPEPASICCYKEALDAYEGSGGKIIIVTVQNPGRFGLISTLKMPSLIVFRMDISPKRPEF